MNHLSQITRRAIWLCTLLACHLSLAQSGPLDLLPIGQATHVVANSGNWTNPNTWTGGVVPTHLAKVLIPQGKTLTVDGQIATRIKVIRIQGKLQFSTTQNTSLDVESIVQDMSGELEIGSATNPIPQGIDCKIKIIDEGNLVNSSSQFEKGLVLLGKTVAYGAAKSAWHTLTANPVAGATTIDLDASPVGWQSGDRIAITGTDVVDASSDEIAVIQSISGSTITLTAPLSKNHSTPAADLFVHVANLSRNVVIESENLTSNNGRDRGHIMFMHTLDVDFNNVRLYGMGRTRKDIEVDDWSIAEDNDTNGTGFHDGPRTNIRGRYSIHFHRGGVNQTFIPAYVRGCVVEDDPGWAYVNHSSFVHFEDNVSYNIIGGAFQTESGDEIGSFKRNLAIRTVNPAYPLRSSTSDEDPDAREGSQDFAFQGDGFWIHGGGVSVEGNIASGCSGHGFIYWPEGLIEPGYPTGTYQNTYVPSNLGLSNNININDPGVLATGWYSVTSFKNNQTYSSTIGLATFYLHTTFFLDVEDYDSTYLASVHSTFENFTAWNIDQQAVQLNYTERVTLKDFRLLNNDVNNNSVGIWASHFRAQNVQVFDNMDIQGFGTGFALPSNGSVTVTCGTFRNGTNFFIPSAAMNYRDMRLDGLTTSNDPAFSNPVEIKMEANFTLPHSFFPAFFLLPDKIILNYQSFNNQRLYFNEQEANYIPLPVDGSPYTIFDGDRVILSKFATKTNQQLLNDYGMSFGGSIMPSGATTANGVVGGKVYPWQSTTMYIPVCIEVVGDSDISEFNDCIDQNGSNLIEIPLPNYSHPSLNCNTVSIDEYGLESGMIELYPNPTNGILFIPTEGANYEVDVYNLSGVQMLSSTQEGDQIQMDISHLPTGIYILTLTDKRNGHVSQGKIIKTE